MMYNNAPMTGAPMLDANRPTMGKPTTPEVRPGVAAIMQAMQGRQDLRAGGGPPIARMMPKPVAPMQAGAEQFSPVQAGQQAITPESLRKGPSSVEQSMRDARMSGLSPDLQRRLAVFMNNRG